MGRLSGTCCGMATLQLLVFMKSTPGGASTKPFINFENLKTGTQNVGYSNVSSIQMSGIWNTTDLTSREILYRGRLP